MKGEVESLKSQLNKYSKAPKNLILKIGAPVLLIANLDFSKQLVNGSVGVVLHFNNNDQPVVKFGENIITMEKVEFPIKMGEDVL